MNKGDAFHVMVVEDQHEDIVAIKQALSKDEKPPLIKITSEFWSDRGEDFEVSQILERIRQYVRESNAMPLLLVLDNAWSVTEADRFARLSNLSFEGIEQLSPHELPGSVRLLRELRSQMPAFDCPIIVLTNYYHDSWRKYVRERLGVEMTLEKGTEQFEDLRNTLVGRYRRYMQARRLDVTQLGGSSPAIKTVKAQLATIVRSVDVNVLITGNSGSGKGLIASILGHAFGGKDRYRELVPASRPKDTLASELFGHEIGSFTGAVKKHIGLFETCEGGAIFLDEIVDLPIQVQTDLLRVLESRKVEPIGSGKSIPVRVSVIAATNQSNFDGLIAAGTLRPDLLNRLKRDHWIRLPPLQDRLPDLHAIAETMLRDIRKEKGLPTLRFTRDALSCLEREIDWSRCEARELRGMLERAADVHEDGEISKIALIEASGSPRRPSVVSSLSRLQIVLPDKPFDLLEEYKTRLEQATGTINAWAKGMYQAALDRYDGDERQAKQFCGLDQKAPWEKFTYLFPEFKRPRRSPDGSQ